MELIARALFCLVCEAVAVRCSSVSCNWILTTWVWSDRAIFMSCRTCGLSVGVFNGGWLPCLGVDFLCICLMVEQLQSVVFFFFFFSFRGAIWSEPLGCSSCLFCCIFQAVVRQISMLFIGNKDSVFCICVSFLVTLTLNVWAFYGFWL